MARFSVADGEDARSKVVFVILPRQVWIAMAVSDTNDSHIFSAEAIRLPFVESLLDDELQDIFLNCRQFDQ